MYKRLILGILFTAILISMLTTIAFQFPSEGGYIVGKPTVARVHLEPDVPQVRVTSAPAVRPTRTLEIWVLPTLVNYTPSPCTGVCRPTIYGNP